MRYSPVQTNETTCCSIMVACGPEATASLSSSFVKKGIRHKTMPNLSCEFTYCCNPCIMERLKKLKQRQQTKSCTPWRRQKHYRPPSVITRVIHGTYRLWERAKRDKNEWCEDVQTGPLPPSPYLSSLFLISLFFFIFHFIFLSLIDCSRCFCDVMLLSKTSSGFVLHLLFCFMKLRVANWRIWSCLYLI